MAKLGRPRAKGPSESGRSTEEDILLAAAKLFTEIGYGSTSTHRLADEAGLSQATMYHYFAGKKDVLLALLLETVRPSVTFAQAVVPRPEPTAARIWALCAYDARLLLSGRHNVGALYLVPELSDDHFTPFHAERKKLYIAYRKLVGEALGLGAREAHPLASAAFGLVESVILRRRTEGRLPQSTPPLIADSALRILGLDPVTHSAGDALVEEIGAELPVD
ncbi:TetR/AcrR family transcriptional regulator [Nocardioides immobilis]|uniref:TetR/AcrR family transcriptional regulator n=1 Tax=Nocardioides immobilis TaxID=2049295 RepID=A0A417XS38_9ACTN|nr:TetR/AcrR family transcriptional regulator [Nocardioides immobilis]RHW23258.1 TetR/AcrR family transcriptional regulator [Nocardioides immobilis]